MHERSISEPKSKNLGQKYTDDGEEYSYKKLIENENKLKKLGGNW